MNSVPLTAHATPYLALAAMLMAGLDGIEKEMEPPPPIETDIFELPASERNKLKSTPGSLSEALRLLREQWEKEDSKELFMIQMLPELVQKITDVISSNLSVERLTFVDNGGNGGGLPHVVGSLAGSVNAFFEQMRTLTGMDIAHIIEERHHSSGGGITK